MNIKEEFKVEEKKIMCAECGELIPEDRINHFNNEAFCEDCYERITKEFAVPPTVTVVTELL